MEINGGDCNSGDISQRNVQVEGEAPVLSSSVYLDHVGDVTLTLNSDGLSWKSLDSFDSVSFLYLVCLRIEVPSRVKF